MLKDPENKTEHQAKKADSLDAALEELKKAVAGLGAKVDDIETKSEMKNFGDSFKLPHDIYSILATAEVLSFPFIVSLFIIIIFQYTLLGLMIDDQTDFNSKSNPLILPANVEPEVRFAQALLLIVALYSQNDLLKAIKSFRDGVPKRTFETDGLDEIHEGKWFFCCTIRLIQGGLNLLASFVLCVQSESVFDVLLNVLGVHFISELDDIAFQLGYDDFFGSTFKQAVVNVMKADFCHSIDSSHRVSLVNRTRSNAHGLAAFFALVGVLGIFSYLGVEQDIGTFSQKDIQVEFGDGVLPYLGLFNGCYKAATSSTDGNGRLLYEQVGFGEKGGRFRFCSDLEDGSSGWVFYIANQTSKPCTEYILRSGNTQTFDILEAVEDTAWYSIDDLPLDYLEMKEVINPSSQCGRSMLDDTIKSCAKINMANGPFSRYFEKLPVDSLLDHEMSLDPTLSHPIYYHKVDMEEADEVVANTTKYELLLFTGRRWIQTDTNRIPAFQDQYLNVTVGNLQDFFYKVKAFDVQKQERDWIILISEAVEASKDQGTPLGLQWFEQKPEVSGINFSSANQARPSSAVFSCAVCNSDSNPCLYEGECNNESGVCDCSNSGATGALCQDKPLENGVCNTYFNNPENFYDGGDCVAFKIDSGATCSGSSCGVGGLQFDYEGNTPNANDVGFGDCRDPAMSTFTVSMTPTLLFDFTRNQTTGWVPGAFVECAGTTYAAFGLQEVPSRAGQIEDVPDFQIDIHLPSGVECTMTVSVYEFLDSSGTRVDAGSMTVGTASGIGEDKEITWKVPTSKCIFEYFSATLGDVTSYDDLGYFENDAKADELCLQGELYQVMDRFGLVAAWSTAYDLNSTDWVPLSLHHCSWTSVLENGEAIGCDPDLRVRKLIWSVPRSMAIPAELGYLSRLASLVLSAAESSLIEGFTFNLDSLNIVNAVTSSIAIVLPSEIGKLQELESLGIQDFAAVSFPAGIGELASLKNFSAFRSNILSIPSEIGNLSSLQELDFWFCNIAFVPSEIGNLRALTSLRLSETTLPLLPPELFNLAALEKLDLSSGGLVSLNSEISGLTSLSTLDLSNNLLSSLNSEVSGLQSLEKVDVSRNRLSTLPSGLFGLPLRELDLGSNSLVSLGPEIAGLGSSLTSLDVRFNDLESLDTAVGNLTALRSLDLSFNDLAGLPTEIGYLSSLQSLNTRFNKFTTLPTEIGNLRELESLDLGWNWRLKFQGLPSELYGLSLLTSLGLASVDPSLPTTFFNLTRLVALDLSYNDLTALPPAFSQLQALEMLDLNSNDISLLPSEIGNLSFQLSSLDLSSNKVQEIPSSIGNLKGLLSLNLSENDIVALPTSIGNLSKLSTLQLEENMLETIPASVGNLRQLRNFNLKSNFISMLPTTIGVLSKLSTLELEDNELLALPSSIGNMQDLTKLTLQNNNIVKLPTSLGLLTGLSTLELEGNAIDGIPSEMGRLTKLTKLMLKNNDIATLPSELGNLSDLLLLNMLNNRRLQEIPSEIFRAQELQSLTLANTTVEFLPTEIGTLGDLRFLWVERAALTSLPSEIGELRSLTSLYLNDNAIPSLPTEMGGLVALENMNLAKNDFVDIPSEIGNLQSLKYLSLDFNAIASLPSEIGLLQNLTVLGIFDNVLLDIPSEIASLTSLEWLSLRRNKISSIPIELANLSALTTLSLAENYIETLPAEISLCANLTYLYISLNNISSIPTEIGGGLSKLQDFGLFGNLLTEIPSEIGSLTSLSWLSIGRNALSTIPTHVGNLTRLSFLYLSENSIQILPSEIGMLTSLTNIQLASNSLTSIPSEIGTLTTLQVLNVTANPLSSLPSEIGGLQSLTALHLPEQGYPPSLPPEIRNLTQGVVIYPEAEETAP